MLKLQAKAEQQEKELDILRNIQQPASANESTSDNAILENTFFQTTATTDSSLYSFLDIGDEQDAFEPNTNSMRHYYSDLDIQNKHVFGIMTLPEKDYALFLAKTAIKLIGHEYYLFEYPKFLNEIEENYTVGLKTDNPSWMCYFFISLAIGQQYVNDTFSLDAPGLEYYKLSLKLFQRDFETPTIELVRTQLMMAFFQQGLNRSNTASLYYGQAIRTSLALGLHRKSKSLDLVEREKRRRLWWTCYIMDSIWAAKLGQPIHVQFDDITVEMEEITKIDDDFNNDILSCNSELAKIIAGVMRNIYNPTSIKRVSDLLNHLEKLSKFQQNLPKHIRELIVSTKDRMSANLYMRLNQIVIITIRPLILSIFNGKQNIENTAEINLATKKCITAASSNICILEELRKLGWFSNFGFWDARYLFSSLLVLYMTGDTYKEVIELGRQLNKKMSELGNFTAIENEIRLKELDILFNKIKESTSGDEDQEFNKDQQMIAQTPVVSPNTLLMDDIANTFSNIDHVDLQAETNDGGMSFFHPLPRDLPIELYKNLTENFKSWDTFGL